MQLEFQDCPHCGKRIATTATQCHRCKQAVSISKPSAANHRTKTDARGEGEDDSHMAINGGYDSDDDFDYDEFIENEFGKSSSRFGRPKSVKLWVWLTAWGLLIFFAMTLLLLI